MQSIIASDLSLHPFWTTTSTCSDLKSFDHTSPHAPLANVPLYSVLYYQIGQFHDCCLFPWEANIVHNDIIIDFKSIKYMQTRYDKEGYG
jgi:hypothetical protein